jgi:hypothetical protein
MVIDGKYLIHLYSIVDEERKAMGEYLKCLPEYVII